jgi:hypothetical protein
LFDEAMAMFGGKGMIYTYPMPVPYVGKKVASDIEEPISVEDFVCSALRPPGSTG